MRVFVAGATGAIGQPLVKALVAAGHEVAGLTRRPERAEVLEELGAHAIVCDVYSSLLTAHFQDFAPQAVIHQVTDLPSRQSLIPLKLPQLNKARTRGTDALIEAARAVGAERFIAQSVAFPLAAPAQRAINHLERATLGYPGIVARYGLLYGPRTWSEEPPASGPAVHVERAARATVELLAADAGVYEITDAGTRAASPTYP